MYVPYVPMLGPITYLIRIYSYDENCALWDFTQRIVVVSY